MMNQYMFMFQKVSQRKMPQKIWITQSGNCIVCHNKSEIPSNGELNIICEDISLHFFQIVEKWKEMSMQEAIKFYC